MSVYGQDSGIYLDATKSIDPLLIGYKCTWSCPAYLGGCGTASGAGGCVMSLTYEKIRSQIAKTASINYYLD